MTFLTFLLIFLVPFFIFFIYWYNKIISYKNYVENAYRLIDVNLQKRADLIPNLVDIIKVYNKFEKELINEITETRSNILKQKNDLWELRQKNEHIITNDLKKIFAVSENYPDLKANKNFLRLQKEIKRVEENLSWARKIYNSNLNILNTTKQIFPYNIVAWFISLPEYKLFKI